MALGARPGMSARAGRFRPTWRTWLYTAIALGAITYVYLFVSAVFAPPLPPESGINQVAMQLLQVQGQRGTKLGWKFGADSAQTSTDGGQTTYVGVHNATYYEKGKPAYRLSADSVTLDTRSQNYSATGNVHVWALTGAQPRDIRADNVNWNQPLQTLTCPGSVTIAYKKSHFMGNDVSVDFHDGSIRTGVSTVKVHP
jgi:lipopolysaccharide assembly outer membrane protein LptD (OstA)